MAEPTGTTAPGRPVEAESASFPVKWELRVLPHLHWSQDRLHYPAPVGPLSVTFDRLCFNTGSSRAFEEYSMPAHIRFQAVNGYLYSAEVPVSEDRAVLVELGRESERRVEAAVAGQGEAWELEFLPELRTDIAAFRAFDYARTSDVALSDHLDWVLDRRTRHWHLHFLIVVPSFRPVIAFEELYRSLFGTSDVTEPYRLLDGLGNHTVDAGHALWQLSRLAARSPAVREAIERAATEDLFERLAETREGRGFAKAFRAYLDEFGWRGDSVSMEDRTWVDYPGAPQNALRAYLAQPDEASPALTQVALARQRETAVAAARQRLAGSSPEVRERFEQLLAAAQVGYLVHEDHNHYIDQMSQHLCRRAFVEAGKRLVSRGQIDDPENVLLLTFDEIRSQLRSSERPDLRQTVDERRAQLSFWRTLTPPATLGAPPPARPTSPNRFRGDSPPPSAERQIRGNAGSKGRVSGIARVAMTLAEASTLQSGEILVCPTTAPSWTPMFAVAAAVVTDTGGILSHCAVVAREYGIPAVVGTGVAASRIRSGQRIVVDGSAGTVTLE